MNNSSSTSSLSSGNNSFDTTPPPSTPKATPLPIKKLGMLMVVLVNESITQTTLLPIVGLMVAHMQGTSPNDSGYVSGFLVGMFQLAQVFTCKMWGRTSDVAGRKPVLQSGLIVSAICVTLFGLSGSVAFAAAARFLYGLGNGNMAVAKTVVGEVTDKTNEAKGFAVISLTYGLGTMIGPTIGGMLYDPCRSSYLPVNFSCDGIWGARPALLPCLVGACYSLFAFAFATLFMKETNTRALGFKGWLATLGLCSGGAHEESAEASPASDNYGEIASPSSSSSPVSPTQTEEKPDLSIRAIFSHRQTRTAVLLFMIICAGDITFWETFSLWAIASRDVGGLNINADSIGLILMLTGVPVVIANFTLHAVEQRSPSRVWRRCQPWRRTYQQ